MCGGSRGGISSLHVFICRGHRLELRHDAHLYLSESSFISDSSVFLSHELTQEMGDMFKIVLSSGSLGTEQSAFPKWWQVLGRNLFNTFLASGGKCFFLNSWPIYSKTQSWKQLIWHKLAFQIAQPEWKAAMSHPGPSSTTSWSKKGEKRIWLPTRESFICRLLHLF